MSEFILGLSLLFPHASFADWAEIVSTDPPAPAVVEVGQEVVFRVKFGISAASPEKHWHSPHPIVTVMPSVGRMLHQKRTYIPISADETFVCLTLLKPAKIEEFKITMCGGSVHPVMDERRKLSIEWIPRKADPTRANSNPVFSDTAVVIADALPAKVKFREILESKGVRDVATQRLKVRQLPEGKTYRKVVLMDAREKSELSDYPDWDSEPDGTGTFMILADVGVDLRAVSQIIEVVSQLTDRVDDVVLNCTPRASHAAKCIWIVRKRPFLAGDFDRCILTLQTSPFKARNAYDQSERDFCSEIFYREIKRSLTKQKMAEFARHCQTIGELEPKGASPNLINAYQAFFQTFPDDKYYFLSRFVEVCESCNMSDRASELLSRSCSETKPSDVYADEVYREASQFFIATGRKQEAIESYLGMLFTQGYQNSISPMATLAEKIGDLYEQTGQKAAALGLLITIEKRIKKNAPTNARDYDRLDKSIQRLTEELSK